MSAPGGATRFSVVVPTIGRPRYLEGCLAALSRCRSPGGNFEVIVVNDGGGEAIERVVDAAPDSLGARTTAPRGTGPSAARNAGAAAARGEILAFTDDDCEPRPDWLLGLERALASAPGAAAGGRTVNGVPANRGAAASQVVVDALHAELNRDEAAPRFFASQNIALPADGFDEIGGFPEGFRYAEDRELCERWLRAGRRFVGAPDAIVDHMRTLSLGEFWRQHHGYGRGARAFARARGRSAGAGDTRGVVRALVERTHHGDPAASRAGLPVYVALSQLATTTGYLRDWARPARGRS